MWLQRTKEERKYDRETMAELQTTIIQQDNMITRQDNTISSTIGTLRGDNQELYTRVEQQDVTVA